MWSPRDIDGHAWFCLYTTEVLSFPFNILESHVWAISTRETKEEIANREFGREEKSCCFKLASYDPKKRRS